MKVPYSWLKDFVDIDGISAEVLGDKLVSAGFEIEEVIRLSDSIKNVVVGRVEEIVRHPDSDHMFVCQVNVGDKVCQIVTGAQNVKKGDLVPTCLDGAVLPDGKTIKSGVLRGVKSEGMLCSGAELGLTEDDFVGAGVYGIWIIREKCSIGQDINEVIGNTDIVLDVAVTANRPDANSILGVAREVAAVLDKPLKMPDLSYKTVGEDVSSYVSVENKEQALCPRYIACAVKNVKQCVSPKIMRDRLKAVGIRPINNLVDVTNYVLIEIGQPMHAFDKKLLEGGKIVVRTAQEGEKIVALDGKEYALSSRNLVICDSKKPVAVAGVMGGEYSSICPDTDTVILESARFARDSVRHTARELNLHSDSSARFEKGIDFLSQEIGMKRALALFFQNGWGDIVDGKIDCFAENTDDRKIVYNYEEINKITGFEVPKDAIVDILNRLQLKTTAEGDILTTSVPAFREDIVGINDLTEEVIRIYGYDAVAPRILSDMRGGKNEKQLRQDKLKQILVGKGASEIVSYAFVTPKSADFLRLNADSPLRSMIALRNPLGADISVMRTNLAYSMLKIIEGNFVRGNRAGRLFEIGSTYIPKALPLTELPEEKEKLSVAFYGDGEDYYSIKNVLDDIFSAFAIEVSYKRSATEYLHPGRSADIFAADGTKIGVVGEVHPDVMSKLDVDKRIYIAELDEVYLVENGLDIKPFKPISRYQSVERDLALIAPIDLPAAEIIASIKDSCSDLLQDAYVFDVYTGGQVQKGKKSIAVRLLFTDFTKTLTDETINKEIENVLAGFGEKSICLR